MCRDSFTCDVRIVGYSISLMVCGLFPHPWISLQCILSIFQVFKPYLRRILSFFVLKQILDVDLFFFFYPLYYLFIDVVFLVLWFCPFWLFMLLVQPFFFWTSAHILIFLFSSSYFILPDIFATLLSSIWSEISQIIHLFVFSIFLTGILYLVASTTALFKSMKLWDAIIIF